MEKGGGPSPAHVEREKPLRIIEKLQPVEIEDADGAKRQLFTFKNKAGSSVKAMFYTREELPFSQEAIAGKKAVVLGQAPRHREVAEWDKFLLDVQANSKDKEFPLNAHNSKVNEAVNRGEAMFFVENTPQHILDFAFWLGLEDKELREVRQQIAQKKGFSQKGYELLDDLIAGTIVDGEGKIRKREDQEGEALTVMALLGDPEAKAELDKRRGVIAELDRLKAERYAAHAKSKADRLIAEGARLPNGVHATHITKYKPTITRDGLLISSAFDGSNEAKTRNTIHLSLAGPITSAFGGAGGGQTWEEMPYMVTGDLLKMREANGNPLMVNMVDTYFAMNPGEPLFIPGGHLTKPGWLPNGVIREIRGGLTIYKEKNFSPQDIDTLFMDHYDSSHPSTKEEARDKFKKYLKSAIWHNLIGERSVKVKDEERLDLYEKMTGMLDKLDVEDTFTKLRSSGMDKTVNELFAGKGIISHEEQEKFVINLERWLGGRVRNGSLVDYITMAGSRDEGLELLAATWGTKGSNRSQSHSEDSDGGFGLEDVAGQVFRQVKEGRKELAVWDEKRKKLDGRVSQPGEVGWELIGLRPGRVYLDHMKTQVVDVDSRKSIMEGFRYQRFDLTHQVSEGRSGLPIPKNRRMYYLAGVI